MATGKADRATPPPSSPTRGAWLVGAGIFLSRISGFLRDAVLTYYLGTSRQADAWYLGLRTPNFLQNLLGEGTLSASFIPVYATLLQEGKEEEARRFAGAAVGIVALLAYGLALLCILLLPWGVPLVYFRLEPETHALLVTILRPLFLMTATFAVAAWALGVLNAHRRFFLSYVAPVGWNGAIVATALVAGGLGGWEGAAGRDRFVIALAWGALAGSAAQFLVMLPTLRAVGGRIRPRAEVATRPMREAIRGFVPAVLSRGVVNASALLDAFLAALLVGGAVTSLSRAQTLYLLPISLFAMAVAASELPELSRMRSEDGRILARRVSDALHRVSFLLLPTAAAYLLFGDLIVGALLERGAFGRDDTRTVAVVLGCYAIGLPAAGASRTLTSAFFALREVATAARIAILRLAVSIPIGILLMFPFDRYGFGMLRLGAAGLALGSAAGAWTEYLLLRRALRHRIGTGEGSPPPLLPILLALLGASLLGAGSRRLLSLSGWLPAEGPLALPLLLLGTGGVFGVSYLVGSILLGGPDPRTLLRRRSSTRAVAPIETEGEEEPPSVP